MKKNIFVLLLIPLSLFAQIQTTLKTVGRNLTLTNGQNIILRGINYPIINEGSISLSNPSQYRAYIDQVALTGANTIRLPWYTSGQNWRDQPANGGTPGTIDGYVNNGHLSNIVAYCILKGMIPILSIHDDDYITCKDNNWSYFNSTVMNFWTNPAILNLIETNKSHLIINLANEFDYVRWTANPINELNTFKNNYTSAITTLRNSGVKVPIMIDAPDCGQSSTELLSVANQMINSDSEHNLIFSAHAYWGGYASTQSQIQAKLNEAVNTNVCFVLGEIANNQDNNSCGDLDLSSIYPVILQEACSRNIGWLAWDFNHDCTQYSSSHNSTNYRVISTTSNSNNLTTYGNTIVNNSNYGLKATNGCGATTFLNDNNFHNERNNVNIYPNPNQGVFKIDYPIPVKEVVAYDLMGKKINVNYDNGNYSLQNINTNLILLLIRFENGTETNYKIFIK